jgi:hypothetical protein
MNVDRNRLLAVAAVLAGACFVGALAVLLASIPEPGWLAVAWRWLQ